MRTLYLCPNYYLFFFLFSSPNLTSNRLDVYHTSTHGVALVRIKNAGLKCAVRGSLEMQDPKKSPKIHLLGTITQICRAVSSQLRHVISTIGKNLLNSNISLTYPHSMANFGPLVAVICWRVWASQQIATGFASWQRYCTAL